MIQVYSSLNRDKLRSTDSFNIRLSFDALDELGWKEGDSIIVKTRVGNTHIIHKLKDEKKKPFGGVYSLLKDSRSEDYLYISATSSAIGAVTAVYGLTKVPYSAHEGILVIQLPDLYEVAK